MNALVFGRYNANETITHKLDPRNKICLLILLMVAVFMPFKVWSTSLFISASLLVIFLIFMLISKVSIVSLLKSLAGMWFLIIFLLVVYLFVPNSTYTRVMADLNGYKLYYDALYMSGYIILRLLLMLCITMILTSTTKPLDLTFGLEWYMTPLKVVKFPVHIVAMTISLALRFIPTLLEETERIMKAQESRGASFHSGSIAKRFRALISLIIPLFVSSFERSEQLADAMEARGYDPRAKRTNYHKLRFHYYDLLSFILVAGIAIFVIVLSCTNGNLDIFNMMGVNLGW